MAQKAKPGNMSNSYARGVFPKAPGNSKVGLGQGGTDRPVRDQPGTANLGSTTEHPFGSLRRDDSIRFRDMSSGR